MQNYERPLAAKKVVNFKLFKSAFTRFFLHFSNAKKMLPLDWSLANFFKKRVFII